MIRILLVDDQNIVRQGVQALLEPISELKVVGIAKDGNGAIEQAGVLLPDIVIMDIEMPGMSGTIASKKIRQQFPKTKIIVLSSHEDRKYIGQALQAGVDGYLLKSTLTQNYLEQVIWFVYQGQFQMESRLLKKGLTEISFSSSNINTLLENSNSVLIEKQVPQKGLSEREVNINNGNIKLICNNLATSEIPDVDGIYLSNTKKNTQNSKNSSQSRTKKNKFKFVIIPVLSLLTITSIYFLNDSSSQLTPLVRQEKANVIPVETTKINKAKSYQVSVTYTGEVTAFKTSEISFERAGKLIEVFVEEGDRLKAGTHLAMLDTANLKAQRQGLIAQKEQQEAILAELRNGARTEEIAEAKSTLENLQQQLELEKLKNSRREYLYQEGAISREQLDEIVFNRKALSKRLAGAQSNLDKFKNGTRAERVSAQQAVVNRLIAEIKDLDITIDKSVLKSPFDSIVSVRNLDEGTVVNSSIPILTIIDNTQLKVKIGVPVDVAKRMKLDSKQQLTIGQTNYDAVVDSILPEVNTAIFTRTVVLSLPPGAVTEVSPKQIARLTITRSKNTDGYWLPTSALVKADRGLWSCYELTESSDGNNRVKQKYVEILETRSNRVLVRGTLQQGDEIITDGTHRLVPGKLVIRK